MSWSCKNRRDGSVTLKLDGRDVIDYHPTPGERPHLLELSRAVARERQVQNQTRQGSRLSR